MVKVGSSIVGEIKKWGLFACIIAALEDVDEIDPRSQFHQPWKHKVKLFRHTLTKIWYSLSPTKLLQTQIIMYTTRSIGKNLLMWCE